jgi:putative sugar O-methyltransferase
VFWQRQLAATADEHARAGEMDEAELARFLRAGVYGFEDLAGDPREDAAPAFELLARARSASRRLTAKGLGVDADELEHARALDFLDRAGTLDEYFAFIAPLGVRSSMSTARHWHYARRLRELAGPGPHDVLEIGAGSGNLAWFLTQLGLVRSYTIVDLPQMLVYSAYALGTRVDGLQPRFDAFEPGGWNFLSDFRAAGLLPADGFDLCLNVNSFMEMDRETRDGYIDLIYRAGRPGALFFNVNRRHAQLPLPDGGSWDNNPLRYPYRADDDVLVWEDDLFQMATRGKWGVATSLTIVRAARIKP